jgi:hypothetical protein
MKKSLSLVMALVMVLSLTVGCISMGKVKADKPSSISVLLKKVDKCQPDAAGFACITIPTKDKKISGGTIPVYLTVYKAKDEIGFGLYSESGFALWCQNTKEKKWFLVFNGMGSPQTEEQIARAWENWVRLLENKYSLDKAYCGLAPSEVVGEKT